jgi:hypothetical protein
MTERKSYTYKYKNNFHHEPSPSHEQAMFSKVHNEWGFRTATGRWSKGTKLGQTLDTLESDYINGLKSLADQCENAPKRREMALVKQLGNKKPMRELVTNAINWCVSKGKEPNRANVRHWIFTINNTEPPHDTYLSELIKSILEK